MADRDVMTNREYYWATEEDPRELIKHCRERISGFWDVVKETNAFSASIRSWRYYHNLYFPEAIDNQNFAIKAIGEEGEVAGLSVNHYRALLQILLSLATQNRPAFDTKATNSDQKSLDEARMGANVAEYYMREKRIERYLRTAAEHALVLRAGFTLSVWDPSLGKEQDLRDDSFDPETGELSEPIFEREGDMRYSNPTIFDVVYDPTARSWEELQWVLVRTWENRWDLASRYPDLQDDILKVDKMDQEDEEFLWLSLYNHDASKTDRIPVWHFFHLPTEALPSGRYMPFVGMDAALIDTFSAGLPYPYEGFPIHRLTAGELLMTCFGYSPAMDLQSLAEAVNAELSTILTNHKNFGFTKVWTKTGDNLTREQIDETTTNFQSEVEPKPMSLNIANPEVVQFADLLIRQMELLSGVNQAARGVSPGKETSGTALAVLHSQAVQFASTFIGNYYMHLEDVGTHLLKTLQLYAKSERVITILGKHNRPERFTFSGDDLVRIDRVVVQSGNAMTKTLAGRLQVAEYALNHGLVSTMEQLLTLIDTGNLEPLFESERADLIRIRLENEAMMQGEAIPAPLATDNHALDIREHVAKLSDPEIRFDEQRSSIILGHVMTHVQLMTLPDVQMLGIALGHRNPLLGAPPFGALAGGPGGPGAPAGPPVEGMAGRPPGAVAPTTPQNPTQVPVEGPAPPRPPKVPQGVTNAA